MSTVDAFALEAFQNPHLAEGADRVDAIVTVTAHPSAAAAARPLLLGIVVDRSRSMAGERLTAATAAVEAALDLLEPPAAFFLVAFSHEAEVVVAPTPATPEHRGVAVARLRALEADGGTAMATGLALAGRLFAAHPDRIPQALFLTDGKDEHDPPGVLAAVLDDCAGVFRCDCWGVGTDWQVGEVQAIAGALLGRAAIVPEPTGMAAAFRAAVDAAAARVVGDVRLRLWTPVGAEVLACKQVSPAIADLSGQALAVGPQVREYRTGAWAPGESRDFAVAVRVRPGLVGEELLAARPSIVFVGRDGADQEVRSAAGRVLATWTGDASLSARLDRQVAHYAGQEELAEAIHGGLARREAGDQAGAVQLLGNAVRLAHEAGDSAVTDRLRRVVDVLDPATGTVRLRHAVAQADAMDLELESTTTRRARRGRPS